MSALTVEASAPFQLSAPVGSLMRPTNHVAPEDSLERAVAELRRNGGGLLPVVSDGEVVGGITERSVGLALAEGRSLLTAAGEIMVAVTPIAPYASGAEALRRLTDGDGLPLVVADDRGRLMGVIDASDLYPRRRPALRPSMVGGMATPFGVYLTNGTFGAGATGLRVAATGAVLFLLMQAANLAVMAGEPYFSRFGVPAKAAEFLEGVMAAVIFFAGMRLIPLSGTHGAEHQVVHAIERGEELTPEVVRRMPRVHPRCGTNLMVAATLFLAIYRSEWIPWEELRLLAAVILTAGLWRPLGSWMQQNVTTKEPTDKQIAGAIRAGEELLERYSRSRIAVPTFPQRLWNSGILFVIAGSTTCALALWAIGRIFHIDLGIE